MMTLTILTLKNKKVARKVTDLPNRKLIITQGEGALTIYAGDARVAVVPFDLSLEFYEVREDKG